MAVLRPHQKRNSESGYALLSALICLVVGGLIVTALMGHVNTMLRGRAALARRIQGIYAADAGIEDVLVCLKNGISPRSALPQNVNNNQVAMVVTEVGPRTMYAGEWVPLSSHYNWLLISKDVVWDEAASAYKFTITVTWNAGSSTTIHLLEVGAELPPGYSYQTNSASLFDGNLSADEPEDTLGTNGAHLLEWELPTPRPYVTQSSPVKTQIFYITGEGEIEGHHAWVVAARNDIGYVSEVTGIFYIITATSTPLGDSAASARIVADVIVLGSSIYILSWQIHQS